MKNLICIVLFTAFVLICTADLFAESGFDPKIKFKNTGSYSKLIKQRDYDYAVLKHKKIAGSLLGISLDIQLGYGSTTANTTPRATVTDFESQAQGGVTLAALLNINLFGLFNLTTGLDFINKKYEYQLPVTVSDSIAIDSSTVNSYKNNYVVIPMNADINGMVSENIGLSFSGGPYFGFLLNPDEAANGFKNFDFGLNGILTGKYYLNPFMAVILGGKVQYGGLNNLISTSKIESGTTLNWAAFTGLSFGI